jgi:peptidoglycan/xylan/chitin deacetylase (PgdA/CDA1 family)
VYKKYFTVSYDDGLEQDKKIIEILKRYNIKGTFNISSGILGKRTKIGRIGNYGLFDMAIDKKTVLKTSPHYIIPRDEIAQVYQGFEVASHAYCHEYLSRLPADKLQFSISEDVRELSALVGYQIAGLAYPYGATSDAVVDCLKKNNLQYARTVKSSGSFAFPQDPLRLQPTCWHGAKNTLELLDQFIRAEPVTEDLLFYMWGHGYEFDYGAERNSWGYFERICEMAASHDEIICCTNKEAFEGRLKGVV